MTLTLVPVLHYSPGYRDVEWSALRADPDGLPISDGVLVGESISGVCLTVAGDHRNRVVVLDADFWADLCDAIRLGLLDTLMGGRAMCEDPNRPLHPVATESQLASTAPALGLVSA
ncbi:hypothetical protein AB0O31_23155 [Kitasatospora cineracea]|uniref:hypothetical protein n=1 Tax=Kitasatospora cineracea TaxID=88074 RepID=UPI0034397509